MRPVSVETPTDNRRLDIYDPLAKIAHAEACLHSRDPGIPNDVKLGGVYIPHPASGQITVAGRAVSLAISFTFQHLTPDGGVSAGSTSSALAVREEE